MKQKTQIEILVTQASMLITDLWQLYSNMKAEHNDPYDLSDIEVMTEKLENLKCRLEMKRDLCK